MVDERELKMRCLELAAKILGSSDRNVVEVVAVANQLYVALPPAVTASQTQKAMHKSLERTLRKDGPDPLGASLAVRQSVAR
jgi:hypothetical protein